MSSVWSFRQRRWRSVNTGNQQKERETDSLENIGEIEDFFLHLAQTLVWRKYGRPESRQPHPSHLSLDDEPSPSRPGCCWHTSFFHICPRLLLYCIALTARILCQINVPAQKVRQRRIKKCRCIFPSFLMLTDGQSKDEMHSDPEQA